MRPGTVSLDFLYRFNGFPYDPRETDLFRALAPDGPG